MKYEDEYGYKGIWRTIKGTKVFIRDGEDLSSALARHKEKFKNYQQINKQYKIKGKTYKVFSNYYPPYQPKADYSINVVSGKLGNFGILTEVYRSENLEDINKYIYDLRYK